MRPGCTVVVCTYQRADSLRRFLTSLYEKARVPDEVVIVDASFDDRTERLVKDEYAMRVGAGTLTYVRATGEQRGLTRQRNLGAAHVSTDLLCFFDDDVVLVSECVAEMESVHRRLGDAVAGVGAYVLVPPTRTLLWRLRRMLGIVSTLEPGRYDRGGMSTPWENMRPEQGNVDGDWLPGCGAMWKTAVVRELGFCDHFEGYCQGEDLEFSLRARRRGRLVMCGSAQLLHLQEPAGRPNSVRLGYMALYNRYWIHSHCLADRQRRDAARFVYTWTMDSLLLLRHVLYPSRVGPLLQQLWGRAVAAADILLGRPRRFAFPEGTR